MQILARFTSWVRGVFGQLFSLLGKLILVFLVTLAIAWGLGQFLDWTLVVPGIAMKIAAVTGIGVAAALFTRWIFRKQTGLLAWLSAWLCLMISLLFLDYFSGGKIGFHYSPSNTINWDGLWQLLLGGLTILSTMLIWRVISLRLKGEPERKDSKSQEPQKIKLPIQSDFIDYSGNPGALDNRGEQNKPKTTNKKQEDASTGIFAEKPGKNSKNPAPGKLIIAKEAVPVLKIQRSEKNKKNGFRAIFPAAFLRKTGNKKPGIRLVGKVEHRCPYCLEMVEINDPQGVVICPICHSCHHKSCWDVTGTCQVPHLHE